MSFREKDFVERMLEQLSRLAQAIAGRRGKVEPEVLVDEIRRGKEDFLGTPLVVLDALGPRSVAELLGSAKAVRAYAELLELEAELLDDARLPNDAQALRVRIEALRAVSA